MAICPLLTMLPILQVRINGNRGLLVGVLGVRVFWHRNLPAFEPPPRAEHCVTVGGALLG
jgi:hypothetical protein